VKYTANQLVQIIKASAVSYYGERAHRNSAVIEVSPHHMGEFPLARSWQLLASEVAETGGWLTE
jgi:hypothetical protein